MSARARLLILAGVLLLAGLGVGYFPYSSGGVPCGSAFGGQSTDATDVSIAAITAGTLDSNCDGAGHTVRLAAIGLLVAGGVSLAACWVVPGARRAVEH